MRYTTGETLRMHSGGPCPTIVISPVRGSVLGIKGYHCRACSTRGTTTEPESHETVYDVHLETVIY